MMDIPTLPGCVRVSNLRRERDRYMFNISFEELTLRDVYFRLASGEFGFPAQPPTNVDPRTCQILSEALQEFIAGLPAIAHKLEDVQCVDIMPAKGVA